MSETVALDVQVLSVKTKVFEGPLELLLELVEKRKLLINDISLATVTDEYMATVSSMQEQSLPHTAQFVQLAATLLLIKSKSLLPVLELTDEEESAIEDLEERLKQYQVYRDAGKLVEKVFGRQYMFARTYRPSDEPLFVLDQFTALQPLEEAMRALVSNLPVTTTRPKVQVRPVISLDEMIARLETRVQQALRTTFSELVAGETEPKTVIVGFLAILESVKQGSILVAQMERFADIEIERQEVSIPRY